MARRLLYLLLICVSGCALARSAHGTPITPGPYDLTGMIVSAGSTEYTLTGDVTIGGNDLISAADITLNDAALGDLGFTKVSIATGPAGYGSAADSAYLTTASGNAQLYLSYLPNSGSAGDISFCILSAGDCNSYQASYLQVYSSSSFGYLPVDLKSGAMDSASVTPSSTTPEPSSLLLLATGIGVAAIFTRRRFV